MNVYVLQNQQKKNIYDNTLWCFIVRQKMAKPRLK